jgi:hypothetical protein
MAFINISTNQIDSYILVVCQKTRPVENFYIVVLSKKKKKKSPNNKKDIFNDKYRHTRDRLFGLLYDMY